MTSRSEITWIPVPCFLPPGMEVRVLCVGPNIWYARLYIVADEPEYAYESVQDTMAQAITACRRWAFTTTASAGGEPHDAGYDACAWLEISRLWRAVREIDTARTRAASDAAFREVLAMDERDGIGVSTPPGVTGVEPPEANSIETFVSHELAIVRDEPPAPATSPQASDTRCSHEDAVTLKLLRGYWCQRCGALDRFGDDHWFTPFGGDPQ